MNNDFGLYLLYLFFMWPNWMPFWLVKVPLIVIAIFGLGYWLGQ